MRRTYISPEFRYDGMAGTFNMKESASFFGSKMMDIEDSISIENNNIIYYQNAAGEQLNLNLEKSNEAQVYNTIEDKRLNHTIELDPAQSHLLLESSTQWIVTVDLKLILTNYLYSILKSSRTFEGVRNEGTIYNNVNDAIRDYVSRNLLSRYVLDQFNFWISYVPLSTQGTLRYRNVFSETAIGGTLTTRVQTSYTYDKSLVRVGFAQELPSNTHCFDYYFTMSYVKL